MRILKWTRLRRGRTAVRRRCVTAKPFARGQCSMVRDLRVLEPRGPDEGSAGVVMGAEAGGTGEAEGAEVVQVGNRSGLSWFLVRPRRRAFAEWALAHMQVDGRADGAHELVEVAAVEVGVGVEDRDGSVDFEDDLVGEVDGAVCPGGIDFVAIFISTLYLLYRCLLRYGFLAFLTPPLEGFKVLGHRDVPVALLVERHVDPLRRRERL
ncbi:hypothetical protein KC368_g31 [Hortaea werneckii]|nr:hypothetical protein KC368_g31 [Hortaea werneckii]